MRPCAPPSPPIPAWKKKTGAARAKLLMKLAQLVEANGPKLAELESLNAGKPIRDFKAIDAVTAIDALEYFAGMATKIQGDTIPVPGPYINMTLREPLGVIGGIIPWNYPLLQAVWKIAPAIAAGNTVVVKPAEQACLSVMFFGKLCTEAGIPAGVVNIVPGYGTVAGAALVDHHMVAKVMFTGSTMTGKRIAAQAANTLKPIGLELGGKSAVIVFEDAPIDQAAQVAAMSIFSNMGQVCTAGLAAVPAREGARQGAGEGHRERQEDQARRPDGPSDHHGPADLGQAEGTRHRLYRQRQERRQAGALDRNPERAGEAATMSARPSSTACRTR